MMILPYTTESDYHNNVDNILTLLKQNVPSDNIILTDSIRTRSHNIHDAYEYSKKYNIMYMDDILLRDSLAPKNKQYTPLKYIVNIGAWSGAIVSNDFCYFNPDITVIHIQNSIKPIMYTLDKFENLERFNTTISYVDDILAS
jgi:hypothetical protein